LKKIFILGASGSIGENALSVIDSNKENFELVGISANSNVEKVNKVIKKYNPKYIYINDKSARETYLKLETKSFVKMRMSFLISSTQVMLIL
jgi:1-deoxy-D-xylulose-5-phosphate reductoisomerase